MIGTVGERCRRDLHMVADKLGYDDHGVLDSCFDTMTSTWRDRPIEAIPRWSGLTLDLTPFETSVSFDGGGGIELRFTTEAQADPASAENYWERMLQLNADLAATYGAGTENFERVADLYRPDTPQALLAGWHGAVFSPGRAPAFKIYLSPEARGRDRARDVVDASLDRLGLGAAAAPLTRATGREADWSLVSLDLSEREDARLKLYERFLELSVPQLAERVALGNETRLELLLAFHEILTDGGKDPPWWHVLVYSFIAGACARTTFHLPVPPTTPSTTVHLRVQRAMEQFGMDPAPYRRIIAGSDLRPTYVSCQEDRGLVRLTAYLATRVFEDRHGLHDRPVWPSPVS